ncbi:thiamine-phosphate diphosphorylase [Sporosarcina sp. P37]|uniref:thiamine phosphate synthase n=1 Tax=unclassified Sporosarcina TaxID=2647733 RepID=UPI0009C03522|nr:MULTISPECIES: thiamine phosphate synthase [unclassified Sporosarcina]ARD48195.1 thiamine phosphate synthase [Sporosarcina sp. P33]ARK24711.1 thiamine-phosphate diphosphorylase [Sporosarcina sp. P37]PID19868.1 thiamine phosphate synthase [Sporosarcina sp. P35]
MRAEEVRKALGVYFVMGTPNAGNKEPLAIVEAALRGGVTCFQLREKGLNALEGEALLGFAKKCQALCRLYRVPFIVNDDVDLALAINADGVHVGQDDEQADRVRERIGPDKWLGVSTHNAREVQLAQSIGADYVGLGPIFPTSTKPDASAVVGIPLVEEIHTSFPDMPMVAIGGITPADTGSIIQAGADGVAVVSAIASAKDPQHAARNLLNTIQSNLK